MTAQQMQRRKKAFLNHFAQYGNITQAARHAGIDRVTVYRWQEHDERFLHAFRDAEIQSTEMLEAEARRRAVDGVESRSPVYHKGELVNTIVETKYSDTLLIFLLKARNPAKYRDNSRVELTGKDGGPIDVDLEPADRIARRIAQLAARVGAPRVPSESEA